MAVSLRVTGSWAELTADGSVAIPSTPQAGDRMYLFARWKDFSITASVSGWTEITQFADGSITSGNGTGSVKVACWYRDWQSGDTNPTIDFSANPTNASVVIMVMQKDTDDVWATPLFRTAAMTNWTTTSQSVSASSSLAVPSDSVVMGLIGIRDDTATMTRPTNGIDDAAGAITWNGNYVESPATHHSTTTGDDGAADLGYRLVSIGATVTLRMTGTISAAETGSALWVVQSVNLAVIPSSVSLSTSGFAPSFRTAIVLANGSLSITPFAVSLKSTVVPLNASLTVSSSAPSLVSVLFPANQSLTTSLFAPTINTTQNVTATPSSASLTITALTPTAHIPSIIFLDAGGDQVQTDGYFGVAQGTGTVSFDTSQKVNGLGSWKFDSGAGNGFPHRKVAGVLPQGAGRIGVYFRYNSIPDTSGEVSGIAGNQTAYTNGGFALSFHLQFDDGNHATATPAKNSAQGSLLSDFGLSMDASFVIDSVKIIYQRSYSTASSIGISRVRWLVNEEEGPNHDNTDMPLSDTVVEVDVTADRTWTWEELNAIQVIAEALRGDTDTSHTQFWDYVAVQVEYHTSIEILSCQAAAANAAPLRLDALPTGSGVVIRFVDLNSGFFDGITMLAPNVFHRIAMSWIKHGEDNLEVKVFVNGIEELWVTERDTPEFVGTPVPWPDLLYGWGSNPGASKVCWFDQLYIDDVDDLSDPGPLLMTNKSGASVNQNNFDTTGGTGAVDERPVSLTNFKQQAGSSQQFQTYALQAANVGDVDISGEDLVGHMGWAIAKKGAGSGSGAGLTVNGVTTDVTLPTSAGLLKAGAFDESYPSNAAGIGLRSIDGDADTFLYECGTIVVYQGPPEDILFAEYLLLEDQTAEVVDDLRASPPSSYMLRYLIREGGGTVTITAYSITAEGESPREWRITEDAPGGSGLCRIGVPGIEVRVIMEVSDADTFVMLQGYLNV